MKEITTLWSRNSKDLKPDGAIKKPMQFWISSMCALSFNKLAGLVELYVHKGGVVNADMDSEARTFLQDIFLPRMHDEFPKIKKPFTGKIEIFIRNAPYYEWVKAIEE